MEIDSVQVESTPKSWPQPTRDEVDASEYVSINVTYIIHPLHFYVKLCDEDDSAKLCSDIEVHMTSVGRNFPLKELKKGRKYELASFILEQLKIYNYFPNNCLFDGLNHAVQCSIYIVRVIHNNLIMYNVYNI